jgi:hypothetical protein
METTGSRGKGLRHVKYKWRVMKNVNEWKSKKVKKSKGEVMNDETTMSS